MAQLVGAGGRLAVATYALEACDYIFVLHALYKAADTLQVAVSATVEFLVNYYSVLSCHLNETGTCAACLVGCCLHDISCI